LDSECGRYWFWSDFYRWKFEEIPKNLVLEGKINWGRGNTWANDTGHTSMNKVTYLFETEKMFAYHSYMSSKTLHLSHLSIEWIYLHHARWTGQIHLRSSLNLKPSMPLNGIYGIHGTNHNHIIGKRMWDPSHVKANSFLPILKCQQHLLNKNFT